MRQEALIKAVTELIGSGKPVSEAVEALLEIVREQDGDSRFLRALRRLDTVKAQRRLERWLETALTKEPPPSDILAYWFGLFETRDDQDRTSCELYLAGSRLRPEDDPDWAVDPAYFPSRRYSGSRLLGRIYQHANAPGGPETHGEYFALWFSALAVADLCRTLGTALLGDAEHRAVVVGFDEGDCLEIGALTRDGFQPARYEPPSLPEIRPTDDSASFYRLVDDPRGRWWLVEPTLGDGQHLPMGFAALGIPIVVTEPLVTTVRDEPSGEPSDFTFSVLDTPIVNERVRRLLEEGAGAEVQFVPLKIVDQKGPFWVLDISNRWACLDRERSDVRAFAADHPLAGEVYGLGSLVLDARRLPDARIFRLEEHHRTLIVSRAIKQQFERERISGVRFEPVATTASLAPGVAHAAE